MMIEDDRTKFIDWMAVNYPDLLNEDRERLLRFANLVIEGSGRIGLVARGDLPRIHMRHLREAVAPAFIEAPPPEARVLDVGSGGGFPGIPLGILRRDIKLSLLEPRHRRAAFLERAVLLLNISDTSVYTASIDAFARGSAVGRFDWIVSRGVGWTAAMVRCLERVATDEAHLVRFGAPDFVRPLVRIEPIDADSPRAVQVWPRMTWIDLPEAR